MAPSHRLVEMTTELQKMGGGSFHNQLKQSKEILHILQMSGLFSWKQCGWEQVKK